MLHLQRHLPLSFRHQWLLSVARFAGTASTTAPPDLAPFAVEDYLVASCNLNQDQALKASKTLSHLKSPSKPNTVLTFLSGLGLAPPEIAAVVARNPRILCCKVDKTLAPRLAALQHHGFSTSQIARLVVLDPSSLRRRAIISQLKYLVPFLGSFDDLLNTLKRSPYLLGADLDDVVKLNVRHLRECGLGELHISMMCRRVPALLYSRPELVRMMVVRAEALGVRRGSGTFKLALEAVSYLSEEKITAKVEVLKETFRWSDAEVGIAISKMPSVLTRSNDLLRRVSEFLIIQAGLEPEYIAHRPALISYSLEHRLMPRHYVVKFLKENDLLKRDRCYYGAVTISEKTFMEKFIIPYKEAAPDLIEDYAAACKGEVPSRFRL